MTTDLPPDIAAIKARADAATPGPWHDEHTDPWGCVLSGDYGWIAPRGWPQYDVDTEQGKADAEFIAHARTDVPALLAALDAAQQREAEFHATLAADGFVAVTTAEHDELERLRAQVADMQATLVELKPSLEGEWQYGVRFPGSPLISWAVNEEAARVHAELDRVSLERIGLTLVRRRVGPVEPVDAQGDSAATDPPHPQPDTQTGPQSRTDDLRADSGATGRHGGNTRDKITE